MGGGIHLHKLRSSDSILLPTESDQVTGLVLFSVGTALHFTVEPVASHLHIWMLCFPSKTDSLRKKKNDPWPPASVLCSLIYLRRSLQTNPAPVSPRAASSPPALRRAHLTPAQESCSFSPFHSQQNLVFSTSKRRLVCTSCFKQ